MAFRPEADSWPRFESPWSRAQVRRGAQTKPQCSDQGTCPKWRSRKKKAKLQFFQFLTFEARIAAEGCLRRISDATAGRRKRKKKEKGREISAGVCTVFLVVLLLAFYRILAVWVRLIAQSFFFASVIFRLTAQICILFIYVLRYLWSGLRLLRVETKNRSATSLQ